MMIDRIQVAVLVLSKKFVVGSALMLSVVAMTVDPAAFSLAAIGVITAIGGAAVLVINAIAKMKLDLATATEVARQEMFEKQKNIQATVDTVKSATDGLTATAVANRTADANTIAELRDQLSKSEERATRLAQAVASATTIAASQTPIIIGSGALPAPSNEAQSLDHIDTSTKAIDANTRRTSADVQDLKKGVN